MTRTCVRVTEETWSMIKDLATKTNTTMQDVVQQAIEDYRRKKIWEETNQAFLRLKNNPEAWQEELQERQEWENTIGDNQWDRQRRCWLVDLNPIRGHEQAGKRPALIVSVDLFNQGPAELVVVVPITTKYKGIPLHVKIEPPEGGLKDTSFIKCEDIRSISKERLMTQLGTISPKTMASVEDRIRILLGL